MLTGDDLVANYEPVSGIAEAASKAPAKNKQANAEKMRDGNKTVCLGYISSIAHAFAYPNYGTVARSKKTMPETTVSIRDTLNVTGLRFQAVDGNYKAFAWVDVKTARLLKDIIKLAGGVKFMEKLQVHLAERDRIENDWDLKPQSPWECNLRMTVHVNVPKRIAGAALRVARQHGVRILPPMLHTYPVFEEPKTTSAAEGTDIGDEDELEIAKGFLDEDSGVDDSDVERNAVTLKQLFSSPDELPEAEQPEAVQTSLLPYQKQGLHFMLERERDPFDDEEKPKGIAKGLYIWEEIQDNPQQRPYYYNKVLGTLCPSIASQDADNSQELIKTSGLSRIVAAFSPTKWASARRLQYSPWS
jgi:hypothetical protein